MSEPPHSFSWVNLGELSKPITVLIERSADALGGWYRPTQILRIARAEAEAAIIDAHAQVEVADIQRRAIQRFVAEETDRQQNIENIMAKAIPDVNKEAKPEDIEKDWLIGFFDKARLVSDDEVQKLWAKILSGEANSPGTYSKRTVGLLASLSKDEADAFSRLVSVSWQIGPRPYPLIFDLGHSIYQGLGLSFETMMHLQSIGLITRDQLQAYTLEFERDEIAVADTENVYEIKLVGKEKRSLNAGNTFFTRAGEELSTICFAKTAPGFSDYVVSVWEKDGIQILRKTPYARKS